MHTFTQAFLIVSSYNVVKIEVILNPRSLRSTQGDPSRPKGDLVYPRDLGVPMSDKELRVGKH